MAALIEAERVRARLSLGSGSASGFNTEKAPVLQVIPVTRVSMEVEGG